MEYNAAADSLRMENPPHASLPTTERRMERMAESWRCLFLDMVSSSRKGCSSPEARGTIPAWTKDGITLLRTGMTLKLPGTNSSTRRNKAKLTTPLEQVLCLLPSTSRYQTARRTLRYLMFHHERAYAYVQEAWSRSGPATHEAGQLFFFLHATSIWGCA